MDFLSKLFPYNFSIILIGSVHIFILARTVYILNFYTELRELAQDVRINIIFYYPSVNIVERKSHFNIYLSDGRIFKEIFL